MNIFHMSYRKMVWYKNVSHSDFLNLLFISLVLDDDDNDGVSNRVIFGGILDLLERWTNNAFSTNSQPNEILYRSTKDAW